MKKHLFSAIIALIGIAWILLSCDNNNEKIKIISGEDPIDLSADVVQVNSGKNYETYAISDLKISNTSIEPVTFMLYKYVINRLQGIANQLGPTGGSGGYITGLQIKYGIDTTHSPYSIELFLRPGYFKRGSTAGIANTYYYNTVAADNNPSNFFYSLSTDGTITQDVTGKNVDDQKHYQKYMTIVHYTNDPKPWFNPSMSDTGDIRTLIYSFQELDTIMKVNSDTAIKLRNISYPFPVGSTPYLKHDLLLVPSGLNLTNTSLMKTNFPTKVYANLANMCPPDCPSASGSGIYFTLLP